MIGINHAIQIESRQGTSGPFAPNDNIQINGRANGIQVCLKFHPHEMWKALVGNKLPERIVFEEEPRLSEAKRSGHFKAGTKLGITSALIQPCFLNYFERLRPNIEQRFGGDPYQWPSVWNFGRVVRNTFGHNGEIHFRSANAVPVSWRHYTYSPADNGRVILFKDVGIVELIYLMADMDAAAP